MMNQQQLVERVAQALQTDTDSDQGRRLVLLPTGSDWRLGYAAPTYAGAWSQGLQPLQWVVLDWLTGPDDAPSTWCDLALAARVAMDIRTAALEAAGPIAGEILVVVAPEQPQTVVI